MRYVAISNRGTLDRRLLEYIGLSTKKGKDVGKVGFKGSGTKLSGIASVRADLDAIVTSTDVRGSYWLKFSSAPLGFEDHAGNVIDAKVVVYRYWIQVDGVIVEEPPREKDFVLDGFADWDQPIGDDGNPVFKIVREPICNAYDEDGGFTVSFVESGDLRFAPPGWTVFYLRCTDAVRAIFEDHSRYFKFFPGVKPYERVKGWGAVWPKSSPEETRLFVRGVLASCTADQRLRTLFDYDVADRELLSEERILKSEQDCRKHVGRLLMRLRRPALVRRLLAEMREGGASYEAKALSQLERKDPSLAEGREFWLRMVHEEFGERIVLRSAIDYFNLEAEQLSRYVIVGKGNAPLEGFLRLLGVPTADEVVPRNIMDRIDQIAFGELSPEGWEMFRRGYAMYAKHFPDYARAYPVAFFRARHPGDEVVAQQAAFIIDRGTGKEMWIKVDEHGNFRSVADILESLVHEPRHGVTDAHDHDRRFVAQADRDIVMAILRHEGEPFYEGTDPVRGWGDPDATPYLVLPPTELATRDTDPEGLSVEYEDGPIHLDPNAPFIDVEENQD